MNIAPENINKLEKNQIFVYGANEAWRHGRGAAKQALNFGAKHGKGPFWGQTYGICTKDKKIKTLSLEEIKKYVDNFILFAEKYNDLYFLVTKIGCGLAGYKSKDIAPFFKRCLEIKNIALPEEFIKILNGK